MACSSTIRGKAGEVASSISAGAILNCRVELHPARNTVASRLKSMAPQVLHKRCLALQNGLESTIVYSLTWFLPAFGLCFGSLETRNLSESALLRQAMVSGQVLTGCSLWSIKPVQATLVLPFSYVKVAFRIPAQVRKRIMVLICSMGIVQNGRPWSVVPTLPGVISYCYQ